MAAVVSNNTPGTHIIVTQPSSVVALPCASVRLSGPVGASYVQLCASDGTVMASFDVFDSNLSGATFADRMDDLVDTYLKGIGGTGLVTRWSGGTTGLTPSTLTSGDITVSGVLVPANGGTGSSSALTGNKLMQSNAGATAIVEGTSSSAPEFADALTVGTGTVESAGTISQSLGGLVTGVGTNFTDDMEGGMFTPNGFPPHVVSRVNSATQLVLSISGAIAVVPAGTAYEIRYGPGVVSCAAGLIATDQRIYLTDQAGQLRFGKFATAATLNVNTMASPTSLLVVDPGGGAATFAYTNATNAQNFTAPTVVTNNTTFTTASRTLYQTGSISQTGTTITGVGTTFTTAMVGGVLVPTSGTPVEIVAFVSTTELTGAVSQSIASGTYRLYYGSSQIGPNGYASFAGVRLPNVAASSPGLATDANGYIIAGSGGGGGVDVVQTIVTATGAGTYTPTAGMTHVVVEVQGPGGAGSGASAAGGQHNFGNGGGGGGYVRAVYTAATIGASQAYVVGVAGSSDTSFSTGATGITGGRGGAGATQASVGTGSSNFGDDAGGAAGTTTVGGSVTGALAINGSRGGNGFTLAGTGQYGGRGGDAHLGNGGADITGVNDAGNAGGNYGGGGGGAAALANGPAGGAGGAGCIVFTEYIAV